MFCYVNSVFAPGLDEGVGGLWRVSDRVDLDRGIGGKAKKGKRVLTEKAVFQDGRPADRCLLYDAGVWLRCIIPRECERNETMTSNGGIRKIMA